MYGLKSNSLLVMDRKNRDARGWIFLSHTGVNVLLMQQFELVCSCVMTKPMLVFILVGYSGSLPVWVLHLEQRSKRTEGFSFSHKLQAYLGQNIQKMKSRGSYFPVIIQMFIHIRRYVQWWEFYQKLFQISYYSLHIQNYCLSYFKVTCYFSLLEKWSPEVSNEFYNQQQCSEHLGQTQTQNKRLWMVQSTTQSFLLIFNAALNFFAIHVVMIEVHLGLVTVTLSLFWMNNPNLTSLSKYMYYYRSVWWVTNYRQTLNLSQVTQHLYTSCFVAFKVKAQFGFPMEKPQVSAECRTQ